MFARRFRLGRESDRPFVSSEFDGRLEEERRLQQREPIYSPRVISNGRSVDLRKGTKMDIMPSTSILALAGTAIGILAIFLWYLSRAAQREQAALVKARFARLRESQLGAYEKARVDRYLNDVNASRPTPEEAQHGIAAEWIAAYRPMPHGQTRI